MVVRWGRGVPASPALVVVPEGFSEACGSPVESDLILWPLALWQQHKAMQGTGRETHTHTHTLRKRAREPEKAPCVGEGMMLVSVGWCEFA